MDENIKFNLQKFISFDNKTAEKDIVWEKWKTLRKKIPNLKKKEEDSMKEFDVINTFWVCKKIIQVYEFMINVNKLQIVT